MHIPPNPWRNRRDLLAVTSRVAPMPSVSMAHLDQHVRQRTGAAKEDSLDSTPSDLAWKIILAGRVAVPGLPVEAEQLPLLRSVAKAPYHAGCNRVSARALQLQPGYRQSTNQNPKRNSGQARPRNHRSFDPSSTPADSWSDLPVRGYFPSITGAFQKTQHLLQPGRKTLHSSGLRTWSSNFDPDPRHALLESENA